MNRNVSIWRGSEYPPTTKHVWIDDENNFLLHNGSGWRIVINTDGNNNGYVPDANLLQQIAYLTDKVQQLEEIIQNNKISIQGDTLVIGSQINKTVVINDTLITNGIFSKNKLILNGKVSNNKLIL